MVKRMILMVLLLGATTAYASDFGGLKGLATDTGKMMGQSTADA